MSSHQTQTDITQMYLGLFKPDIVPFILFISICVGVCATVCGCPPPPVRWVCDPAPSQAPGRLRATRPLGNPRIGMLDGSARTEQRRSRSPRQTRGA